MFKEAQHETTHDYEPKITVKRHSEVLRDERARVKKAWHSRIGYLLKNKHTPRWIEFYLRKVLNNDNIFGVDKEIFTWIINHEPEK